MHRLFAVPEGIGDPLFLGAARFEAAAGYRKASSLHMEQIPYALQGAVIGHVPATSDVAVVGHITGPMRIFDRKIRPSSDIEEIGFQVGHVLVLQSEGAAIQVQGFSPCTDSAPDRHFIL